MGFDLDQYRQAHAGWALTTRGQTYHARPVSAEQVIVYQGEVLGASPRIAQRALRKLLRIAFPWRPSFVWRGDPVKIVMGARPHEHRAMVADFFASLAGSPTLPTPSPTHGTPS